MLAPVALALLTALSSTPATPVTVTVIGTNDLHGRVERVAALSAHLRAIRADAKKAGGRVVVVDGGDMFQGTLESNLEEGKAVVDAYNAVGYDAVAIGNHEFDFGPVGDAATAAGPKDDARGAIKARAKQAKFPFLAANILDVSTGMPVQWPNVKPSVLLPGAIKVGVVGVTTVDTPKTTIASNFAGLAVAPLAETIEREARALRAAGARVVVVAAHAGGRCGAHDEGHDPNDLTSCDADAEIAKVAAALPRGLVDVIVAGHTHQAMAHTVNGIAIIESWANGRGFGRVDVTVDAAGAATPRVHAPRRVCGPKENDDKGLDACTPTHTDGRALAVDAAVLARVAPALKKAAKLRSRPLGAVVVSEVARGYDQESALGNLFADLMREARPDVDVALMNGGGIRSNLRAGPLTYGAVFEMMPFDNRFATVRMTVAELRAVLEKNLDGKKKGGILSTSGIGVMVRCAADGKASVAISDNSGAALVDDRVLVVATTDFVATGGDGGLGVDAARVVVDESEPVREHLARAFAQGAADKRRVELRGDDPLWFNPAAPRIARADGRGRCPAPAAPAPSATTTPTTTPMTTQTTTTTPTTSTPTPTTERR
jgi:2',3'-cyclic-nucleotide 2'-phosphodiesterase (5'-nucleotidase family)